METDPQAGKKPQMIFNDEAISITDFCDMDRFEEIIRNWTKSTGLAAVAIGNDGRYLSKYYNFTDFCQKLTRKSYKGLQRCIECDKTGYGTYLCHAGLVDFGAPITLEDGRVLGNILGGQVLPESPDEEKYLAIAEELGIDKDAYIEALHRVNIRSREEINAAADLLASVVNMFVRTSYSARKNKIMLTERADIIASLSKIYFCDYYLDIDSDHFIMLDLPESIRSITGDEGTVSVKGVQVIENYVKEEYREELKDFIDLHTLKDRMDTRDSISLEFMGKTRGWCRALFISVRRSKSGEATNVIFAVESIQEEKKKEIRIRQMLQETANRATSASRAKSEFLAHVSHDLRTPLNAVIGLSELALLDGTSAADRDRYLTDINNSGKYLLGLINDVLDMSRIESHKIVLSPEVLSFDEFCGTVRNVIEVQCSRKNQDFSIIAPPDDFAKYIIIDKTHFMQIVVNLLTNAVKYTPEGGSIELIIEHLSKKGRKIHMRLTVRDNGIGISEEFLPEVFDAFAQERNSSSNSGTGLGLSIVRHLTELMGGTIRIESEEGKGTAAILEIDAEEAEPQEIKSSAADRLECIRGKRMLLCEDNHINSEIVTALLRGVSVSCDTAEDGKKGLEMFKKSEPGEYDAVLMDMRMPVMDGIEATRAIRLLAREDARTVPIIAITANAFDEDRRLCIEAGMNGHISKPIDSDIMLETIAAAVSGSR